MSKTNPLKYAAVADIMEQHELMASAVEAHGVICGLVCGGVALDDKSWLPHFNDLVNDGFGLPAPVRQVMTESLSQCGREFDGPEGRRAAAAK